LGFESEPGFGSSGQIVDTEGDEAESLEKNSLKHFENFEQLLARPNHLCTYKNPLFYCGLFLNVVIF
jgi:hypothetical protein